MIISQEFDKIYVIQRVSIQIDNTFSVPMIYKVSFRTQPACVCDPYMSQNVCDPEEILVKLKSTKAIL